MTHSITSAVLALILALGAAETASAQSRSFEATGPDGGTRSGTWALNGDGTTTRTVTGTGARGGSYRSERQCGPGDGAWTCSRGFTRTGPGGRTWTGESDGSYRRFGGERTRTITGPGGKTATRTWRWQR